VKQVLKASKVFRGKLDRKVQLVQRVQQVLRVSKAHKVSKVKLVRQVLLEQLDRKGLRALKEQQGLKALTVFLLIKLLLLTGSVEQKKNG
jgi:hypothetical protein